MKTLILCILTGLLACCTADLLFADENYQVNFQTQFPAQNQFYIDDYNQKAVSPQPYRYEEVVLSAAGAMIVIDVIGGISWMEAVD